MAIKNIISINFILEKNPNAVFTVTWCVFDRKLPRERRVLSSRSSKLLFVSLMYQPAGRENGRHNLSVSRSESRQDRLKTVLKASTWTQTNVLEPALRLPKLLKWLSYQRVRYRKDVLHINIFTNTFWTFFSCTSNLSLFYLRLSAEHAIIIAGPEAGTFSWVKSFRGNCGPGLAQ